MNINTLRESLKNTGAICFSADKLFNKSELECLEVLLDKLPQEHILIGDADESNDVYVGRVMVDNPGEKPTLVNQDISSEIVDILSDDRRMSFFEDLLGGKKFIRRAQVNIMTENSFIGRHLDNDSNPDYEVALVIQLGKEYGGGEFVVHPHGQTPVTMKTDYHSMTVTRCSVMHEVQKVTSGARTSFVYFLADHADANRRVA